MWHLGRLHCSWGRGDTSASFCFKELTRTGLCQEPSNVPSETSLQPSRWGRCLPCPLCLPSPPVEEADVLMPLFPQLRVGWRSWPCLWAISISTSSWASGCSGWTQNSGKLVELGQMSCFLTGRQTLPNNGTLAWHSLGRIATNQISQPLL